MNFSSKINLSCVQNFAMYFSKKIRGIPNLWDQSQIHMVHDGYDWVLKEISLDLVRTLRQQKLAKVSTNSSCDFLKKKVIHFNSVTPQKNLPGNKTIMTWYHLTKNDSRLNKLTEISSRIDILHTSATATKQGLVKLGFPEEKISVIPSGINLHTFQPTNLEEKIRVKNFFGIPEHRFVIGSFQKDGVGWENGMEPKLIKGPDVFCDVVEQVSKNFPIHVLLSGPARGYVMHRLEQARIPYTHKYPKQYQEMKQFYCACDLYLIASRIEGIPMALLESWATGTPLVSTRVGMVADVAIHGKNALLAEVDDRDKLAENITRILENEPLKNQLMAQGLETVQQYDWSVLVNTYWNELYSPLLSVIKDNG